MSLDETLAFMAKMTPSTPQDWQLSLAFDEVRLTFGERWAGGWIRRARRVSCFVGAVAPHAADVSRVAAAFAAVGAVGATVACRYSEGDLTRMQERLHEILLSPLAHDKVLMVGQDPELNKLVVTLTVDDPELIEKLLNAIPRDAICVSVQPGVRIRPLGGSVAPAE